ncbi:MAG TPA: zinc ribbon domain-containing protein [Acidobacteriaceae bacterium]
MAVFCSKCGAQLEGNERFCVKCGHDVTAAGAAPAPVATAPPPPPMAPPPQGYAASPPPGYGAPGPIPVMGVPPPAEPKKNNMMWAVIAIAAAAGGWYYYHNQQTQTPANNPPAPIAGPTQPGGGAPGGGGAPVQPAAPVQPGGPGPGGANAALVQAQQWSSQEEPANGFVQVQNGKWVNGSNVSIQTAVLECDQYNAAQAVIAQNQTNLTLSNPPLVAGNNATFSSFNAGQIATGVNTVNCGIVSVTPAGN